MPAAAVMKLYRTSNATDRPRLADHRPHGQRTRKASERSRQQTLASASADVHVPRGVDLAQKQSVTCPGLEVEGSRPSAPDVT
jgi:hypothetical protein